jgi:hypothetical protein
MDDLADYQVYCVSQIIAMYTIDGSTMASTIIVLALKPFSKLPYASSCHMPRLYMLVGRFEASEKKGSRSDNVWEDQRISISSKKDVHADEASRAMGYKAVLEPWTAHFSSTSISHCQDAKTKIKNVQP